MRNKLNFLMLITVIVSSHSTSFAAVKSPPKTKEEIANIDRRQSINIYPLGLVIGRFGATYSFQVADHIALTPGISARYSSSGLFGSAESIWDIGPSFGARFFLTNTAFNSGMFIEPTVGFNYAQYGSDIRGWDISTQAVAGYAWYWNSGFTLGIAGGLGYTAYSSNIQSENTNLGGWALYPHPVVDFSVGYSW